MTGRQLDAALVFSAEVEHAARRAVEYPASDTERAAALEVKRHVTALRIAVGRWIEVRAAGAE